MRFSYTFKVDKPSELIKLLLYKSQSLNYISVLNSNTESNQTSLPADYISYDLIAGVDDLEVLNVDSDSFNALQNFHDKHKDWLFGCNLLSLKMFSNSILCNLYASFILLLTIFLFTASLIFFLGTTMIDLIVTPSSLLSLFQTKRTADVVNDFPLENMSLITVSLHNFCFFGNSNM